MFERRSLLTACGLATLVIAGCGEDSTKTERGLRYFPDMYQSPAYDPQEAIVVEENGAVRHVPAGLTPPPGTVPADFRPTEVTSATDVEAANALLNPLLPDAATLRLGQERYNVFCAVCHGQDGDMANGYVSDKVAGILSVHTDNVAKMSDGLLFTIITHGRGRMPQYRAQLPPHERWAVVHYLRVLHKAATVSGEERQELERAIQRGDVDEFRPRPEPVPEYDWRRWPAGQEANK